MSSYQGACTFPILSSRKSWRQLPETNSTFLHKITWGMVKHTHMKSKKKLPRTLHTLYQLRRTLWNPSEKSNFLKIRLRIFHFLQELRFNIWGWRKIGNMEIQPEIITYWHPLTLSNLILSPNYVVVTDTSFRPTYFER